MIVYNPALKGRKRRCATERKACVMPKPINLTGKRSQARLSRLCLSEIKLAHTDDEVRPEMA
jgi:hypothetical protein